MPPSLGETILDFALVRHYYQHMSNSQRHVLHTATARGRTFSGESESASLIDYLNDKPTPRIAGIMGDLHRLHETETLLRERSIRDGKDHGRRPTNEHKKLWQRIQRQFAKFPSYPCLSLTRPRLWPTEGLEWGVQWWPIQHSKPQNLRRERYRLPEPTAFGYLIRVIERGLLPRIRHCKQCQKWFYARFKHQEFCQTTCQQANYKSSEQWKEHRRGYMRRYRQLTEGKRFK